MGDSDPQGGFGETWFPERRCQTLGLGVLGFGFLLQEAVSSLILHATPTPVPSTVMHMCSAKDSCCFHYLLEALSASPVFSPHLPGAWPLSPDRQDRGPA